MGIPEEKKLIGMLRRRSEDKIKMDLREVGCDMGGSPGDVSHSSFSNPSVALENELSNISVTSPTSQLILQPFRRFGE